MTNEHEHKTKVVEGRAPEWDEDTDDEHVMRLSCGCMTFEVDIDGGTLTMETDLDTANTDQVRDFCADVVRLYNKYKF